MRWVGLCAALSGAALVLGACGDDGGKDEPTEGDECESGVTFTCVGRNGCHGRQYCVSGELTGCSCDQAQSTGGSPAQMRDAAMPLDAAMLDAASLDSGAPDAEPPADATAAQDAGTDAGPQDAGPQDASTDSATPPACASNHCVAAAPEGWNGPIALYAGTAAAPACAGDYATDAFSAGTGLNAPAATCSTCTCQPGSCEPFLIFRTGTESGCGGVTCPDSVGAACAELATPCTAGATAYVFGELPGAATECTASTQTPTITPASFATRFAGCAPSEALEQSGCASGELCAPAAPGAPFESEPCIYRTGDHACPAAIYTERRRVHESVTDTRGCSACECGSGCSYEWKLYNAEADPTCQSAVTLSAPGQCAGVATSGGKIRVGASITGDGSCPPSGGEPLGAAVEANPITICCAAP